MKRKKKTETARGLQPTTATLHLRSDRQNESIGERCSRVESSRVRDQWGRQRRAGGRRLQTCAMGWAGLGVVRGAASI